MRFLFLSLFCTLSIGIALAADGPLLRLSTRHIDFGRVDQYQIVTQEVLIRNDGDAPLQITKVSADCGCTAGALSDSTVLPGHEVTLSISFRTGKRKGNQKKRVTVLTNDPAEPKTIIQVFADVHPLIRIDKERIRFPTIHRGETTSESFRIAADSGLDFEVVGIEGASEVVTATIRRDASSKEDAFIVELAIRRDAPAGTFRAAIHPTTSGPQATDQRVVISGTILSYFVVEGETRFRFPPTKFGERKEHQIRVTCDGSKPYRLVELDSPVPFITGQITKGENGTWFLILVVTEKAPVGRYQEVLKLMTTDPNQPEIDFEILGRVLR